MNVLIRQQGDVIRHETAEFYLGVKLQNVNSEITQNIQSLQTNGV